MNLFVWLIYGLLALCGGLVCYLVYKHMLRKIPDAAYRFGKAWGRTTDRYRILRALNTVFYITGILVVLGGIGLLVHKSAKPTPAPTQPALVQKVDDILDPQEILNQVNNQRKMMGLKELDSDPGLTAVAQERVNDMIQNQYYAHLNLQGKYFYQLFAQHGFKTGYSCENLDIEFTTDEWQYVNDWLVSTKGHRECMLNKDVTKAGYAVGTFSKPDNQSSTKTYIVVAIHAAPPFKTIGQDSVTTP